MPEYEESKSGPEKETTAELKSIASQAPSHKLVFDSAAPNPNRILCEISHKSIADNLDEDVKLPEEVVEIFVELGLFESDLFFFGTKFFRDRFRDFFWDQNFSRPVPRLFFWDRDVTLCPLSSVNFKTKTKMKTKTKTK